MKILPPNCSAAGGSRPRPPKCATTFDPSLTSPFEISVCATAKQNFGAKPHTKTNYQKMSTIAGV